MREKEAFKDGSEEVCHIPPIETISIRQIIDIFDEMLRPYDLEIEIEHLEYLITSFKIVKRETTDAT